MAKKTIKIVPDTLLMKHLGSSGHTLIRAYSELIDNAIDSFLEHRDAFAKLKQTSVKVSIDWEKQDGAERITILDNAFGMSEEELKDALTIARSAKPDSKTKKLIGRFGMGMKTACSSLGKVFEIRTSRPGDEHSHIVRYDEDTFIKQTGWEIQLSTEKKDRQTEHGTTIALTALKKNVQAKQYVINSLSPVFTFYIEKGVLELTVKDELVTPTAPSLITVKNAMALTTDPKPHDRWDPGEVRELVTHLKRINFDQKGRMPFDFEVAGKKVRGWVGILKKSSQRGNYGFSLIRHDRIVKEEAKIGFKDHPATARVVGEIHLDDWDVNYNKDDFIRDTDIWKELEDEESGPLHERISDVVAISRKMAMRKRDFSDEAVREASREGKEVAALTRDQEFLDDLQREVVEESLRTLGSRPSSQVIKPITTADARDVHSKAKASIEGVSEVRHEIEKVGERAPYVRWDVKHDGKKRILAVRTNADHPFFSSLQPSNRKWYYAFLIAECYAEHVQQEIGYQSLALVKNIILAKQGPRLISSIRQGKDHFNAKLEEHA